MSWGEGEVHYEWWQKPSEGYYVCANCEQQIYYPYKWRNVDKSQSFTKDWKTIKSKIYIQINKEGKHIRLCDCCDELFTTKQLIKLFLINGMGKKGREKEKVKKWNEIEEKKKQKAVLKFGRKIKIYEMCPDCGGKGFTIGHYGDYHKGCNNCLNGEVSKLIPFEELINLIK